MATSARAPVNPLAALEQALALCERLRVGAHPDERIAEPHCRALPDLAGGPEGAERALDGERRLACDCAGRPACRLAQLFLRHHLGDHADLVGAPGGEPLVVPE